MVSKRWFAQRSNEHNQQEFLSGQTVVTKDIKTWFGYAVKNSVDEEVINTIAMVDEQRSTCLCQRPRTDARTFLLSEDVSIVSPFSCCVTHKTILSTEIVVSQLHVRDDHGYIVCTFKSSGTKSCKTRI